MPGWFLKISISQKEEINSEKLSCAQDQKDRNTPNYCA